LLAMLVHCLLNQPAPTKHAERNTISPLSPWGDDCKDAAGRATQDAKAEG